MDEHLWKIGIGVVLATGLVGCPKPEEPECTEFEEVFVYVDSDGDGFGADEPIGYVCKAGEGQSTNKVDCDDTSADVHPGAEELCDQLDNDCNGRADDGVPQVPWYRDGDGDGFGLKTDSIVDCKSPGDGYISLAGDCKDDDPLVNPAMREVCNGHDDDCDKLVDDDDPGVDPGTFTRFYRDSDNDGYGNPDLYESHCKPTSDVVADATDCDDKRSSVHPGASEVCNHLDDDCDTLTDDEDDSIDPETQQTLFADIDGDGHGDTVNTVLACGAMPGIGVFTNDDCNDNDPSAFVDQWWYEDLDGDGHGAGAQIVFQCLNPGGGLASEGIGLDCNDDDTAIHPGAPDACADGVDQDCSGADQCPSCKVWYENQFGATSGVYQIEPYPGLVREVWCDMDTDGGGWTLVGSTLYTPFDDAGIDASYDDLTTLFPATGHSRIWRGMRAMVAGQGDIRFACKLDPTSEAMDVDLSFYEVGWYMEVTVGDDNNSCFNEGNGAGADPPPERRNNLTGAVLPAGNNWAAGFLEGEDTCSDTNDFTVDFDNRGMQGDSFDGTDWGEANGTDKCGTGIGSSWFVFVREL